MDSPLHPVDRAFARLDLMLRERRDLRAEFARAIASFGGGAPVSEHESKLWLRRALEWFVLERPRDGHSAPPFADLLEAAPQDPADPVRAAAAALRGSLVSIFEVTGVEAGRGVWLRDLAALGEYPASEPAAATVFERGDLVAGRIFPLADESWHVSRAAAFFRSADLLTAVRRDLERARLERRAVVRIAQHDLERMFFGHATAASPSVDPTAEVRQILAQGGLEQEEIERILMRLAEEPFDPKQLIPGAVDVLGEILDRIAFDTSVDLERARRLLIDAWRGARPDDARDASTFIPRPARERGGAAGVASALAEFERRRNAGVPLERAFRELEQELDLDVEADGDDAELAPAPDFPGVVAAVVEEYLWEASQTHGPAEARARETVRLFGAFAAQIGVFENLSVRDLLAYTCHWLPENGAFENADAAREHLVEFGRFCHWIDESHGLELHALFREILRGLESSLPRIVEANRRRTRSTDPAAGELFECLSVAHGEPLALRNRAGQDSHADVDPELAQWLRPGDHVRGQISADGRLAVYCVYPPEARQLVAG